jgi:hypothetical protein
VQVAGAAWRAATRIVAGVGDLVQRTGDDHTGWVLGGRTIERSGGTVGGLHRTRGQGARVSWLSPKTKVGGFLVEPQNQGDGGFPSLGLKTGSYGLVIWTSKSPRRFLGLVLKIMQTLVCWLRHKTDGRM